MRRPRGAATRLLAKKRRIEVGIRRRSFATPLLARQQQHHPGGGAAAGRRAHGRTGVDDGEATAAREDEEDEEEDEVEDEDTVALAYELRSSGRLSSA